MKSVQDIIGFIGAGNMAKPIANGLIESGKIYFNRSE